MISNWEEENLAAPRSHWDSSPSSGSTCSSTQTASFPQPAALLTPYRWCWLCCSSRNVASITPSATQSSPTSTSTACRRPWGLLHLPVSVQITQGHICNYDKPNQRQESTLFQISLLTQASPIAPAYLPPIPNKSPAPGFAQVIQTLHSTCTYCTRGNTTYMAKGDSCSIRWQLTIKIAASCSSHFPELQSFKVCSAEHPHWKEICCWLDYNLSENSCALMIKSIIRGKDECIVMGHISN